MPSEKELVVRLVGHADPTGAKSRTQTVETVALALLTIRKWDRVMFGKPDDYEPTAREMNAAANWPDREVATAREEALSLLVQFAEQSVSWRQWWSGVPLQACAHRARCDQSPIRVEPTVAALTPKVVAAEQWHVFEDDVRRNEQHLAGDHNCSE